MRPDGAVAAPSAGADDCGTVTRSAPAGRRNYGGLTHAAAGCALVRAGWYGGRFGLALRVIRPGDRRAKEPVRQTARAAGADRQVPAHHLALATGDEHAADPELRQRAAHRRSGVPALGARPVAPARDPHS